jgi:peptidyl-prolyl cis-trans isomerase SurA
MPGTRPFLIRAIAALAIAAAALAAIEPAQAQVVAIVNGEPITTLDIEQRSKFVQVSTHKAPSRQEVLDQLIDEKLKVREAKRFQIDISDNDVETAFASMAGRTGVNVEQFSKMFASSGINPATLKARIRADMAWANLVRGRFQPSLQIGEADILSAVETKKKDEKDTVGYEYRLRPILFLAGKGAGEGSAEARKRDAEALRARFDGCDEGIKAARSFKDVAIRGMVSRTSADLPPQLRQILGNTAVGRLTPPEVTRQGVEVFAVCSKKETRIDTPVKKEAREELLNARFEERAKRYLGELRRSAMIEYRSR